MTWSPADIETLIRENPIVAIVVGAAAIWLLRRALTLLVVGAVVIAWKFDLLGQIEEGYRRLGSRFLTTPEQMQLLALARQSRRLDASARR